MTPPDPGHDDLAGGDPAGDGGPATEIRVAIPADVRFLRVARLTAAGIASDLGFGLQDLEDLRVAVDELCAVLMDGLTDGSRNGSAGRAASASPIELRYLIREGSLEILGRGPGVGEAPALHPVAAELLRMTADAFEISTDARGRSFRLVKRRHDLTV